MSGIVIDIDGVVADSNQWLRKNIEESSGKKIVTTVPETFEYKVDIPVEDIIKYINEAIIKYKDDIVPHDYPLTHIALMLLDLRFGGVKFLSARANGPVRDATVYWLNKWFPKLNYDLTNIGEGQSKNEWMRSNGFDSIVEDRFRNANNCDISGGRTFLVNRPWNVGRQEKVHVTRVLNLFQAVEEYLRLPKGINYNH